LSGLDLRHIENIADHVEEMPAAAIDVLGVVENLRDPAGPSAPLAMNSEKPSIALSGVRSSWLHIGQEFRLRAVGEIGFVAAGDQLPARAAQDFRRLELQIDLAQTRRAAAAKISVNSALPAISKSRRCRYPASTSSLARPTLTTSG